MWLDVNASRPVLPAAQAAYLAAERQAHLPAAARRQRAWARRRLAALVGAEVDEVTFVGGASEANAWALAASWRARGRPRHLVVSGIEHPSVANSAAALAAGHGPDGQAGELTVVPAQGDGQVQVAALAAACRPHTALVCLTLADGQTGVLQPVPALAAWAAQARVRVHVDAVQAAGLVPVDLAGLASGSWAISGHKLGGVGGIAVLVARRPRLPPPPWRPGGEDAELSAPAAVAMAVAYEERLAGLRAAHAGLQSSRDRLEQALVRALAPARVIGAGAPRLPHVIALQLPGCGADRLVTACDLVGLRLSAGSACHSGQLTPSPALLALGLSAGAAGEVVRLSLPGPLSRAQEQQVTELMRAAVAGLRRQQASRPAFARIS